MKMVMEQLLALQKLQFEVRPRTSESQDAMKKLRDRLPAPIRTHYERLAARGKKGVALVRNGVCLGCHLRLPTGTLAGLADANTVHVCDACGRYLYLPESKPAGTGEISPPSPAHGQQRPRKAASYVV